MSEREVTQEHVDKLVLIADRVAHIHFDVGGDINQCPFCSEFALDHGTIKHRPDCVYLVASTLMSELYPEEGAK